MWGESEQLICPGLWNQDLWPVTALKNVCKGCLGLQGKTTWFFWSVWNSSSKVLRILEMLGLQRQNMVAFPKQFVIAGSSSQMVLVTRPHAGNRLAMLTRCICLPEISVSTLWTTGQCSLCSWWFRCCRVFWFWGLFLLSFFSFKEKEPFFQMFL